MAYAWGPGGDWGGGYQMNVAANPSTPGTAVGGGDLWGIRITTNTGGVWRPSMNGIKVSVGSGTEGIYSRAVAWSKKTPSMCYFGDGGLHQTLGAGYFARATLPNLVQGSNSAIYGFATAQAGKPAGIRPRAGGRLIRVDYPGSGSEYVYACMTCSSPSGFVVARSTNGGDDFTTLYTASGIPGTGAWKSSVLFQSSGGSFPDTLLVGSYRDTTTDSTSQTGSTVWKITSGSGTIRTASGQSGLTISTIGAAPAVVEDMQLVGSSIYAACGPYGVYHVTSDGTTWTKISGSFFSGSWCSTIDGVGSVLYVGCTNTGPKSAGANVVARSADSGTTWGWVTSSSLTHGTSGNINSVPWGTTNEWWLTAQGAPTFNNRLGGSTFDCQEVSVDQTDTSGNTIYLCGSAGTWLSKNGGATWRPSVIGLNGGEVNVIHVGTGANVDWGGPSFDYTRAVSIDHGVNATRSLTLPTGTANTTGANQTDGAGNVYHLTTTAGAVDITRAGVSIADDYFRGGLFSVSDFKVSSDGYVYIGAYGGGLMVGSPNAAPPDTTPPTASTSITAVKQGTASILVTWSGESDNVAVAGSLVYRNGVQVTPSPVASPFLDSGLTANTTYTYTVQAVDTSGNVSPLSGTASATTDSVGDTSAPTIPTGLTATAVSASEIDLTWTASTDNTAVTGYIVNRNGALLATLGAVTSFQDSGLPASTLFTYTVQARDAALNTSAASTAASATTQTGPPPPPPPNNPPLIVVDTPQDGTTITGDSIAIQVTATPTDPAATVITRVQMNVNGGGFFDLSTNAPPPPPDTQAPTIPTGLTATPVIASRGGNPVSVVQVMWQPSSDNIAVAGYHVYRDGVQFATETITGVFSLTDSNVSPSTTYHYSVSAFDAAGNESNQSPAVAVTTLAIQPPTGAGVVIGTATGSGTTSASVTPNTATIAGDNMVAFVSAVGATTVTAPDGWDALSSPWNDGTRIVLAPYANTAGTDESSPYTWTVAGATSVDVTIITVRGGTISSTTPTGSAGTSSVTTSLPGVAASLNDLILGYVVSDSGPVWSADSGCLVGAMPNGSASNWSDNTALASLEALIGRKLAYAHHMIPWDVGSSSKWPPRSLASGNANVIGDYNANRKSYVSWPRPRTTTGGESSYASAVGTLDPCTVFDNFVAGTYDGVLTNLANGFKAWEHPVIVRMFWEMNQGMPWSVTQTSTPNQHPAKFIAAWRYIFTFVRAIAPNVRFHWNAGFLDSTSQTQESYWPGDAYVHYAGSETYFNVATGSQAVSASDTWASKMNKTYADWSGHRNADGLPMPFGSGEGGARKVTGMVSGSQKFVFDSCRTSLVPQGSNPSAYGQWKFVTHWDNTGPNGDNALADAEASGLTAFKQWVQSSYMQPALTRTWLPYQTWTELLQQRHPIALAGFGASQSTNPATSTPSFSSSTFDAVSNINAGRTWQAVSVNGVTYTAGEHDRVKDPTTGTTLTSVPYLTAHDNATGKVITTWAPAPNDIVQGCQLSHDGALLYVWGKFTSICSTTSKCFAVLPTLSSAADTSAASLDATNADLNITGGLARWAVIDDANSRGWLVGTFTSAGGGTHNRVCRITLSGTWSVDSGFTGSIASGTAKRVVAKSDGSSIIVGGDIPNAITKLNGTTGAAQTFGFAFPGESASQHCISLAADDTYVVFGGDFGPNMAICTDWAGSGPTHFTNVTTSGSGYNAYWYVTCDGNIQAISKVVIGGTTCAIFGHHGNNVMAAKSTAFATAGSVTSNGVFAYKWGSETTDAVQYLHPPDFGAVSGQGSPLKVWGWWQDSTSLALHVTGDFTTVNSGARARYARFDSTGIGGGTAYYGAGMQGQLAVAYTMPLNDVSPALTATTTGLGRWAGCTVSITAGAPPPDQTGPSITITQPAGGSGITLPNGTTSFTVQGNALDPSGVATIKVNGSSVSFDAQGNFSDLISLATGDNAVLVQATDTIGNVSSQGFVITVSPPVVTGATKVAFIADFGPTQTTQAVVSHVPADSSIAYIVDGGDNYNRGANDAAFPNDLTQLAGYFKKASLISRMLPTPGNHDWGNRLIVPTQANPTFQGFNYAWGNANGLFAGNQGSLTFPYVKTVNGWTLIIVNTCATSTSTVADRLVPDSECGVGPAQLSTIQSLLPQTGNKCVLFGHHPVWNADSQDHTDGTNGTPNQIGNMRGAGKGPGNANLWAAIQGRAIAYVSGHAHNMQLHQPRDATGKAKGQTGFVGPGCTQIVAGSGGGLNYPLLSTYAPAPVWVDGAGVPGFLLLDFSSSSQLAGSFIGSSGQTLKTFTIAVTP